MRSVSCTDERNICSGSKGCRWNVVTREIRGYNKCYPRQSTDFECCSTDADHRLVDQRIRRHTDLLPRPSAGAFDSRFLGFIWPTAAGGLVSVAEYAGPQGVDRPWWKTHRGISLVNTAIKLLASIILSRLSCSRKWRMLGNQAGFSPGQCSRQILE